MTKSVDVGEEIIETRSEDVFMDDVFSRMSEEAAQKDFMTGYYNMDTFKKIVDDYGRNHDKSCALYIFKINGFSTVCDQLGRFQGDGLLMRTSLMIGELYGNVCMGRLYREIFGILLPDCESTEAAVEIGNSICDKVVVFRKMIKCTLSMGVTICKPGTGSFDLMYKEAVSAMYNSVISGKSQCIAYDSNKADSIPDNGKSIDNFVESYNSSHGITMENYYDGIYVSDPINFELKYLNKKMKSLLGISDDYKGKKCYEVIAGLSHPCEHCTNSVIVENKDLVWSVDKKDRKYIVKDTLRMWNNSLVKSSRYIDVSDIENVRSHFDQSFEMEFTLKKCIDTMIKGDNLHFTFKMILKMIGKYYGAEKAVIYENDIHSDKKSTYEWEEKGFSQVKDDFSIDIEELANDSLFNKNTNSQHVSFISDVEYLKKENQSLYSKLNNAGIRSVMYVEMRRKSQSKGYIVLYNPKLHINELSLLVLMGSYITNELIRNELWNQRTYELTHDNMTGSYNRMSYHEFVNEIREATSLGYVIADVNGMRHINETVGYEYGDIIIKQVAGIIREVFSGYPVFRFDGDEFIICCVDISMHEFEELIDKVKERLSEHEYGASIGYVWDDFDIDVTRMSNHAKELLLIDKELFQKHNNSSYESSKNKMTMAVMNHISNNDFKVYLQPKFNMETGKCIGAEALVRLEDPDKGLMSPASFIPVLEKTGTIHYVDLFVFERVCQILEELKNEGYKLFPVSFNFSRITLMNKGLSNKIEEILNRYDVQREYLEIEITESIGDLENNIIKTMADNLHEQGFRLSMDDFGTKYSSISMISLMKCEILKIDRSMVNDIEQNNISRKVVLHVVAMCRDLGIECIAEGVETMNQARLLMDMGCENAQGYLYGKPMPEEEFIRRFVKCEREEN